MNNEKVQKSNKALWLPVLALLSIQLAIAQDKEKIEPILKARPETVPSNITISGTSGRQGPQLSILENDPNDFARIQMQNSESARFWHIAAHLSDIDAESRLNFYSSGVGWDVLSLTGDGRVGIANPNPTERLEINGNEKVNGNLVVNGKLIRPGTNDINMLPYAMGKVDVSLRGDIVDVLYGTNNFTVRRFLPGIFCISIEGLNPATDRWIGFANLACQSMQGEHADFFAACGALTSCPGQFMVMISLTNVGGREFVNNSFQFVVYKL